MQLYKEAGAKPPLVEIKAGTYLWDAFRSIGIGKTGGFGASPLEWIDIWAYSQATRRVSEPWELETLYEMSAAYFRELERGKNPFAKSPLDMETQS